MSGIRGEYWVDEDGNPIFADGEIGDYTHEGYVIEMLQYQVLNDLDHEVHYENYDFDEELDKALQKLGIDAEYPLDDAYEYLKKEGITKNLDEIFNVLYGKMDARLYAIKYWNWIAVRGHHVEMRDFTPHSIKKLVNGIEGILWEEGIHEVPDEQIELNISIFGNQSFDYTLDQLKNWGKIRPQYRNDAYYKQTATAATNQIRDLSVKNLHPYYQQKTFPIGDSILSFKAFLESNKSK